ncbi:MAG: hypothetical protein ACFFEA_13415, partial [Candidatus Thorarchaeota archaeon]
SRRYQMIRKECLAGFIVAFKPEAFDIHNNVLIVGEGSENEVQNLRARIREHSIPFESTFRSSKKKIFWFVRLQASLLSGLLASILDSKKCRSTFLTTKIATSTTHGQNTWTRNNTSGWMIMTSWSPKF